MSKNMNLIPPMAASLRLWSEAARIAIDSQFVISLRMADMLAGAGQPSGEPFRMVAEKQAAASESFFAMADAASRGASADHVVSAGMRPYGERTRANSQRLSADLSSEAADPDQLTLW